MRTARNLRLSLLMLSPLTLASAATITYSFPGNYTGQFGYAPTAWPNGSVGNPAGTVSIRGFNTALGTLTKVTLTAIGEAYGTYRIQNNSDEDALFYEFRSIISMALFKTTTPTNYTTGQMPAMTNPNLVNNNVFITLRPQLFNLGTGTYSAFYDSGNITYATLANPSTDSATVDLCAGIGVGCDGSNQPLNQFYGSGMINLPVFANVRTLLDAESGNLSSSTSTQARITISSITYEYTANPVPEPGTVTLMASGAAALIFALRKRKQNLQEG